MYAMNLQLQSFLNSGLDGVEWLAFLPDCFTLQKNPAFTHRIRE